MSDLMPIVGRMEAVLRGPNGRIKARRVVNNLVTTVGKNDTVDQLLASPVNGKPTHMGVGTSSTAAAVGDTALVAEIDRNALTSKTGVSTNVLTMVANWAAGDATASITEAGVFNAASTGRMWSRAVFTAIPKAAADTLQITWTWTFG